MGGYECRIRPSDKKLCDSNMLRGIEGPKTGSIDKDGGRCSKKRRRILSYSFKEIRELRSRIVTK